MMKFGTVVLAAAALVHFSGTCSAQCGCSGGYYPSMGYGYGSGYGATNYYRPPAPHYPPPVVGVPKPRPGAGVPGTIAYINRLATPIPRSKYTLNYAIHLTDGRILLSDFLPKGYTVRGIESHTGEGGRRLSTSLGGSGSITVRDPINNSTVAEFGNSGYIR